MDSDAYMIATLVAFLIGGGPIALAALLATLIGYMTREETE